MKTKYYVRVGHNQSFGPFRSRGAAEDICAEQAKKVIREGTGKSAEVVCLRKWDCGCSQGPHWCQVGSHDQCGGCGATEDLRDKD